MLQTLARFLYTIFLLLQLLFLQAQDTIWLYPQGQMPNSKGITVQDSLARERYFQVGRPRMQVFTPSRQENKQTAVLIIPGGGYSRLAHEISGIQVAKWFNTMGVTAFVLFHRLPHSPDLIDRTIAPLQDAQRAMGIIRANAARWEINPEAIGVMGFSAGGHLASTLGTHEERLAGVDDSIALVSFRPDFMLLVSPVISMTEMGHQGSREMLLGEDPGEAMVRDYSNENRVTLQTPPAFLVHANDDTAVSPLNSIAFYQALYSNHIPAALHLFSQGGHSIALRSNPGSTNLWTTLCEEWLKEMGFLVER